MRVSRAKSLLLASLVAGDHGNVLPAPRRLPVFVPVQPSSKRLLRREAEAFLGRRLSGRQWVRFRKAQVRAERAA